MTSECSVVDVEMVAKEEEEEEEDPGEIRNDDDTAHQREENPLVEDSVKDGENSQDSLDGEKAESAIDEAEKEKTASAELDSSGTETASNLSALNAEEEPMLVSVINSNLVLEKWEYSSNMINIIQ